MKSLTRFLAASWSASSMNHSSTTPCRRGYAGRVIAADFVSLGEGTGIVHIAPAYGAEDLAIGREEDLPVVHVVNIDGAVADHAGVSYSGQFFKDADPDITEDLRRRNLLHRSSVIEHTYPFCWRCDSPLLYYAKESWYIRTTALKDRLVSANREIGWRPEHIQEGRFGEWLQNNVDWALSRERYWGTPDPRLGMPIMRRPDGHQQHRGSGGAAGA